MSNETGVKPATEGYRESDSFLPNPTDQYGHLHTAGTTGSAHEKLEVISPVFDVAKKQALAEAARALDPEDDSVPESLVVLPTGAQIVSGDPEGARQRVLDKAKAAADKPVDLGAPDEAEAAAAETGEEGSKAVADSAGAQADAGAGGGIDGGQVETGSGSTEPKTSTAKVVRAKKEAPLV